MERTHDDGRRIRGVDTDERGLGTAAGGAPAALDRSALPRNPHSGGDAPDLGAPLWLADAGAQALRAPRIPRGLGRAPAPRRPAPHPRTPPGRDPRALDARTGRAALALGA